MLDAPGDDDGVYNAPACVNALSLCNCLNAVEQAAPKKKTSHKPENGIAHARLEANGMA
jgi:hypothetical protein